MIKYFIFNILFLEIIFLNQGINFNMSKKEIKEKLTNLQYEVTQNCGTEKPFDNEFWDHKEPGIYVDIV